MAAPGHGRAPRAASRRGGAARRGWEPFEGKQSAGGAGSCSSPRGTAPLRVGRRGLQGPEGAARGARYGGPAAGLAWWLRGAEGPASPQAAEWDRDRARPPPGAPPRLGGAWRPRSSPRGFYKARSPRARPPPSQLNGGNGRAAVPRSSVWGGPALLDRRGGTNKYKT